MTTMMTLLRAGCSGEVSPQNLNMLAIWMLENPVTASAAADDTDEAARAQAASNNGAGAAVAASDVPVVSEPLTPQSPELAPRAPLVRERWVLQSTRTL